MTRNHIFKIHQNSGTGEKGKVVTDNAPQVSQFSQVPGFGEIKKLNSTDNQISKNIDTEKPKVFLGEDWDNYKSNQYQDLLPVTKKTPMSKIDIQPRLIRLRDAPSYLGMGKTLF